MTDMKSVNVRSPYWLIYGGLIALQVKSIGQFL